MLDLESNANVMVSGISVVGLVDVDFGDVVLDNNSVVEGTLLVDKVLGGILTTGWQREKKGRIKKNDLK